MKKVKKLKPIIKYILITLLAIVLIVGGVFMYFGGLGTGDSADVNEVVKYSKTLDDIVIPDTVKVVALGEATHGNKEFQELKLDVFKVLVEKYDVKAFVLEADFGGCESVNRYIHGEDIDVKDVVSAIGFPIYRTKQMQDLINWMREYNSSANENADLRFYGNDMQLCGNNCIYLIEACNELNIDISKLSKLYEGNNWSNNYNHDERVEIVSYIKSQLENKGASKKAIHFADILLQNLTIGGIEDDAYGTKMMDKRAEYMADNVMWILNQEEELGNKRIFVSAHNAHVARYESVYDMGSDLYKRLEDGYYVIGTGYYKTKCNLPVKEPSGKRTTHTVFSHDPIGNALNKANIDVSYLDFDLIEKSSSLYSYISDYHYMGSLGENFSILNRILPMSTRTFQPPATLYNAMIYVTNPTPTVIE